MGHLSVSHHSLSIPLNCYDPIGLLLYNNCNCWSFFSVSPSCQCANAVEAVNRQIVMLPEQETQVGLLRRAVHSLLGSSGAAPSQSKSPIILQRQKFFIHKIKDKTMISSKRCTGCIVHHILFQQLKVSVYCIVIALDCIILYEYSFSVITIKTCAFVCVSVTVRMKSC